MMIWPPSTMIVICLFKKSKWYDLTKKTLLRCSISRPFKSHWEIQIKTKVYPPLKTKQTKKIRQIKKTRDSWPSQMPAPGQAFNNQIRDINQFLSKLTLKKQKLENFCKITLPHALHLTPMKTKKQTILLIETRKQKGNEKDATLGPRPLKKTPFINEKNRESVYLPPLIWRNFSGPKKTEKNNWKPKKSWNNCAMHTA